MIKELYVDGGVIGTNPSAIGGTYAWRLVFDGCEPIGQGKVVTASQMGGPVTNNQTEMLALLEGLKQLPFDWAGTIYSDSAVTLGRAFKGWKWKNIPGWMHKRYQYERKRLINWDQIQHVQLDGHPTRKQLLSGIGKRGNPVSEHNVWCDEACGKAGADFMETVGRNIPTTMQLITDLGMPGAQFELMLVKAGE